MPSDLTKRRWPWVVAAIILLLPLPTYPIWRIVWRLHQAKQESRELFERQRTAYEAIIRTIASLPADPPNYLILDQR